MPQYPTFIIDDEPDAGKLLHNLLKTHPVIEVKQVFTDARQALHAFLSEQPTVIFVDIEMPELSGLEFLQQINKLSPQTKVIFVTAYEHYALEALRNDAFDFLCKPISKADLERVVHKIIASVNQTQMSQGADSTVNNQRILLKTMEGHHYIAIDQILYLEADGNYTFLILTKNRKVITTTNLGKVHSLFPQDQFIRISRKRVINKNYLTFMNFCKNYCLLTYKEEEFKLEVNVKMKDLKKDLM